MLSAEVDWVNPFMWKQLHKKFKIFSEPEMGSRAKKRSEITCDKGLVPIRDPTSRGTFGKSTLLHEQNPCIMQLPRCHGYPLL
jgi:hypothetical protein